MLRAYIRWHMFPFRASQNNSLSLLAFVKKDIHCSGIYSAYEKNPVLKKEQRRILVRQVLAWATQRRDQGADTNAEDLKTYV